MSGWLIFGGYLLCWLTVWRGAFCWQIDSDGEDDRMTATMLGFLAGMVWPITILLALGARIVTRPTPGERRQAREKALQEELAEVKRLAREHGLPL